MDWVNSTLVSHHDTDMYAIADAVTTVEDLEWMVIVDCVILAFTILGASAILSSMAWLEYTGRPSTVRTRLVQALVVSDLMLGVVGMIGTARRLGGHEIASGSNLCDGLGVLLVAVLFTEHFWTLMLAVATFIILIYPLHWTTIILEKYWYMLWGIAWMISFGIAVIGHVLYGYKENGGICFYGSNAGLYGELMQFIPRAFVFLAISILYTRLFVFLRRPDKIRSPYSDSPTNGTYESEKSEKGHRSYLMQRHRRRLSALFQRSRKSDEPVTLPVADVATMEIPEAAPIPLVDVAQVVASPEEQRRASDGVAVGEKKWSGPGEIPPWEKLSLPTFHVNGERFGGPSTNTASAGMWSDWKGLGSRTGEPRKRTSTSPSTITMPVHPPLLARGSGQSGMSSMTASSVPPVAGGARGSDSTPLTTIHSTTDHETGYDPLIPFDRPPGLVASLGNFTPSTSSSQLGEPPELPPTVLEPHIRRASEHDSAASGSSGPICAKRDEEQRLAEEERDGEIASEHAREDEEWDLMRVLQSTVPSRERGTIHSVATSDEYELVPESMSSYLNRKTSMLMLYFPLAYVLLFSVSLIRLIYDFISPNPSTPLRAISRWFVFSQGIVDALIYGVVEWHTKRVVRRKVRKGHFSPNNSRNTNGSNPAVAIGSAIRSFGNRERSKPGVGAGLNPSSRGHNVSFQEDPRSILAELAENARDDEKEGSRKDSRVEFEEH